MQRRLIPMLLAGAAVSVAGCDKTGAYGDANSIILASTSELWTEIEEAVLETLEPRVRTVAEERAFTVTHVDPRSREWANLSEFKQMLVVGSVDDPWVQQVLDEGDVDEPPPPPATLQVHDVWARGQLVTLALVDPAGAAEQLVGLLPGLSETYETQYREYVVSRMFISGRDTALADTLRREAGFELLLPRVYQWTRVDSVFVFRNDNPDPSELIRQVAVTWVSPVPEDLGPEQIVEWRRALVDGYYEDRQVTVLDNVQGGPGSIGGFQAYEIQATWENPPGEWPAGGPFILRAIICPEQRRLYVLDAWLYAPGKEKYEYMIQLQTILNSFRCEG